MSALEPNASHVAVEFDCEPAATDDLSLKLYGANAAVPAKVRPLQAMARGALLFTAVIATGEVVAAKDTVNEAARQRSVIAGSMIGATLPRCEGVPPWHLRKGQDVDSVKAPINPTNQYLHTIPLFANLCDLFGAKEPTQMATQLPKVTDPNFRAALKEARLAANLSFASSRSGREFMRSCRRVTRTRSTATPLCLA